MLSTREWLIIIAIALAGAAATMVYRAMRYAFHIATGIATQSISALLFWAAIGVAVVAVLRLRSARKSK